MKYKDMKLCMYIVCPTFDDMHVSFALYKVENYAKCKLKSTQCQYVFTFMTPTL